MFLVFLSLFLFFFRFLHFPVFIDTHLASALDSFTVLLSDGDDNNSFVVSSACSSLSLLLLGNEYDNDNDNDDWLSQSESKSYLHKVVSRNLDFSFLLQLDIDVESNTLSLHQTVLNHSSSSSIIIALNTSNSYELSTQSSDGNVITFGKNNNNYSFSRHSIKVQDKHLDLDIAFSHSVMHKDMMLDAKVISSSLASFNGVQIEMNNGRAFSSIITNHNQEDIWIQSNHFSNNRGSSFSVSIKQLNAPFNFMGINFPSFHTFEGVIFDASNDIMHRFGTSTGATLKIDISHTSGAMEIEIRDLRHIYSFTSLHHKTHVSVVKKSTMQVTFEGIGSHGL